MTENREGPTNVLIVGGGVAGLESALALRELCGDRVSVEMLSPSDTFTYRPLAVAEPFEVTPMFRLSLSDFARDTDVRLLSGELAQVDVADQKVLTLGGEWRPYDFLIVATGASPEKQLEGALAFVAADGVRDFNRLLYRLDRGEVQRVVFTAGSAVGWSLPMYELALMTATYLRARGTAAEVTVVTPEDAPLSVFGPDNSAEVARLLADAGVELVTGRHPARVDDEGLDMIPEGAVEADEVVVLPGLEGPDHPGLPADPKGFLPTGVDGRISGCDHEFAAGDVTDFPVKQGGIAGQMADAASNSIARELGVSVEKEPFRPTLDGTLLTGRAVHDLHQSLVMGASETAHHTARSTWLPLRKIAARHLSGYLAEHCEQTLEGGELDPDHLTEELRGAWERRVVAKRV